MALTHEIIAYGGWENNLALSNDVCELLITLDVGPRILSFAPKNGRNVFKIFDDQIGSVAEPLWQSRGGHRLWLAPEGFPFSYFPDNEPVDHEIWPNGAVTLTAPDEMPQGFSKQMDVALDPEKARVRIVHRLTNVVDEAQDVSPWALTVMAEGGIAILPQPPMKPHPGFGPGDFAPNRSLILWPFTDLSDPRLYLGPRYFTLRQIESLGPTKLGFNYPMGWAAYFLENTLFVKRFSYSASAQYPDNGSHFEIFSNEEMVELETLGPIQTLKPGGVLEAVEEWELYSDVPEFDPRDDDSVAEMLASVGL